MTPLPVNLLKLTGNAGKPVAFVLVVLAAMAIIAARKVKPAAP